MKTIKINNLEVLVDELRRVIKENPEILQEEKKPFAERMIGKEYWCTNNLGEKFDDIWTNSKLDNQRMSFNNIYWTESSCDKEIARRKALGNILSYIRDNEIELVKDEDWENTDKNKYEIDGWDYFLDKVSTDRYYGHDVSKFSLAFYSQEDREKVISNCAKDLEILLKK